MIVVWALIWPADLATAKPYRWAAMGSALLVLSPLLAVGDTLIRPLAKSQYVSARDGRPGGLRHRHASSGSTAPTCTSG